MLVICQYESLPVILSSVVYCVFTSIVLPRIIHVGIAVQYLKPFEVGCIVFIHEGHRCPYLELVPSWSMIMNNSFILGRGVGANNEMYNWNVYGR